MLVFSRIFSALTEVLGRDIRANDPRMSAGYPALKLPLWAVFSFLSIRTFKMFWCIFVLEPPDPFSDVLLGIFPSSFGQKLRGSFYRG